MKLLLSLWLVFASLSSLCADKQEEPGLIESLEQFYLQNGGPVLSKNEEEEPQEELQDVVKSLLEELSSSDTD